MSRSSRSETPMKNAGAGANPDIILLSTLINILSLAVPIVLLQVYDRILPNQAVTTATLLFIGATTALLVEGMLRWARTYLLSMYAESFEYNTALAAMKKLFRSDIAAAMNLGSGTLKQRLNDISSLREHYSGQSSLVLYDLPFSLIFLAAVWYIGGPLVNIPLALYLLAAASIFLAGLKLQRASRSASEVEDDRLNFVTNILNTLTSIKCLGGESQALKIFRGKTRKLVNERTSLDRLSHAVADFVSLLGNLTTIATVAAGAILVMKGELTTGGLAACTILAGRSLGPVISLMVLWTQLQRTWVARDRIDELWSIKEDTVFDRSSELVPDDGSIIMDNVQVQRGNTVFTFNLNIPSGAKYVLDDPTGRFLPIFIGLLMGSTRPSSGRYLVGGRELGQYSRNKYRESISFVTQQSRIFRGSILDNISLFQPSKEQAAIELSGQVGLTGFIHSLPNGFRTHVGDMIGGPLETGATQRMAVVRALINDPALLFLNQADEGIDLNGKQMLGKLINSLESTTVLLLPSDGAMKDVFSERLRLDRTCSIAASEQGGPK